MSVDCDPQRFDGELQAAGWEGFGVYRRRQVAGPGKNVVMIPATGVGRLVVTERSSGAPLSRFDWNFEVGTVRSVTLELAEVALVRVPIPPRMAQAGVEVARVQGPHLIRHKVETRWIELYPLVVGVEYALDFFLNSPVRTAVPVHITVPTGVRTFESSPLPELMPTDCNLQFVDFDGVPLAGAKVSIVCYGAVDLRISGLDSSGFGCADDVGVVHLRDLDTSNVFAYAEGFAGVKLPLNWRSFTQPTIHLTVPAAAKAPRLVLTFTSVAVEDAASSRLGLYDANSGECLSCSHVDLTTPTQAVVSIPWLNRSPVLAVDVEVSWKAGGTWYQWSSHAVQVRTTETSLDVTPSAFVGGCIEVRRRAKAPGRRCSLHLLQKGDHGTVRTVAVARVPPGSSYRVVWDGLVPGMYEVQEVPDEFDADATPDTLERTFRLSREIAVVAGQRCDVELQD
ncbi:MAG: hypothetical protein AB7K09_10740 [Planctomycetota bacterium]